MSVFEEAKDEWRHFLTGKKWPSTILGETYYIRYPVEAVGTAEAQTYKKSIYRGDDSVHAWDASGIRQTIIQRMIETQERTIRPWYGEISFFSDATKFLHPMPESELDFILRTSLSSNQEGDESLPFLKARNELLGFLDPDLTPKEEKKTIYYLETPEDRAKKYCQTIIELYGLLNITKDRLFILEDDEIQEFINLMLDINKADKFLVKRFVEINEEDNRPFIGLDNQDIKKKSNFLLKYIAGGDEEYYRFRVFQLWLRNLLGFDTEAKKYIEEMKSDLILEFNDEEIIERSLMQAIKLHLWISMKERYISILRTDYATKLNFSGYKSDLIHLLNSRKDLFSEISPESQILPIEPSKYDPRYTCHELGIAMIESILDYLSKQIPEPEGFDRIQSRFIVNKRISNMRKYVLTDEIKDEILGKISDAIEKMGLENEEEEIEKLIREPYNRIVPRGEHYFKTMETEVKQTMEKMGDKDLRKELALSTDDPQTLVKQYGLKAIDIVGKDYELEALYSTILSLKSNEIIFSGTSLSALKKQRVIESFINDLFSPQFDFLRLLDLKTEKDHTEE
ncbi:MAG: hypothetical protein ACXADY_23570 [Candidatus Hodarchaeales archaeon]|jgi:hypothetical protein